MRVACNAHNVLTGPSGVARVFGPQKGATQAQVETLDAALTAWAEVLRRDCAETLDRLDLDVATGPGTGASGGLGAGLAAGLGALLLPRFEVMLDHVELDALLASADLVITGEGAVDFQTPKGKIPAEVARRAKLHGKPVIALAGSLGEGADTVYASGIDAFASMLSVPMPLEQAVEESARLLSDAAEHAIRLLLVGSSIAASARG